MNHTIVSILYLLIRTVISQQTSTTDDIFWYTSSPIMSIQQTDVCASSSGIVISQCLQPPFQQCCAIFSKECGLNILCFQDNQKPTIIDLNTTIFVSDMKIQVGTANLWVADPNFIYLFDMSNPINDKVNQKAMIAKQANAGLTISINFFANILRLFVVNTSGVHIYDISTPEQIAYVGAIPAKSKTQSIMLAPDIKQIFIVDGSYRILRIDNIQDIQNTNKPLIVEDQCSFAYTNVVISEVVNNQFLLLQTSQQILSGVDLTAFLSSGNCKDLKFQQLYQSEDTYLQAVLTPNKKYVILSINYLSISVIEIQYSPLKATLFQKLDIYSYLYQIRPALDFSFIMVSNKDTIDIYQQKKPNYNQIIPSIINTPQIIVYDKFISTLQYAYSCFITPVNKYILSAKGTEGTYIFKEDPDSHFLHLTVNVNPPVFSTNLKFSKVFNVENNLIIGRDSNIYIYDISDIQNPVLLSSSNFNLKGIQIKSGVVSSDSKRLVLAGDSDGILLVDISDLKNPILVSQMYQNYPLVSKCVHVTVSSAFKYVYATFQNQGFVIYNIQDFTKPIILSYYNTFGGYISVLFKSELYLAFADQQNGIKIVDVSDVNNPSTYSKLRIDGSVKECNLIESETFLICTSRYRGQLILIDIRNLKTPKIVQKFQYKDIYGGLNVCYDQTTSTIYLGLISAVIRISVYPKTQFDMDLLLIQEGSIIKNTFLDTGSILKVGMIVKVTLTQVYPLVKANINGAQYYNQFKIQDLPSWATFSTIDSSLQIQIDKEALMIQTCSDTNSAATSSVLCENSNYTDEIADLQFIFLTQQKLSDSDFVSTSLNIDLPHSQQIFQDCILANLVDHDYLVEAISQEIINYLLLGKYPQNIVEYIYYILSQKNTNYPIIIQVQGSLTVSIDDDTQPVSVQSINDYLYVEMTLDSKLAQFIPFPYSGVLVYLSDKNDWIKIEGDLDSMVLVLQKGIKVANFTDPENISIAMTFDDATNFVISKTIKASHKQIITLNQPVHANKQQNLQDDFENKFSGASIYILDTFSYTFSSSIFLNPDSRTIQYEAKILENDVYIPIPQQFWLLFQSQERVFFGTTTSSQYGSEVKLLLNATDGYTYAVDYLEIKINQIPIQYIFLYAVQILSPIIGLLGMWKYRSMIYNRTQYNQYKTTRIEVKSGEQVVLQMPLLGNSLQIAQDLWKDYYPLVIKSQVLLELNEKQQQHQPCNKEVENSANNSGLFSYIKQNTIQSNAPAPSVKDRSISKQYGLRFQKQFIKNLTQSIKKKEKQNSVSRSEQKCSPNEENFFYFNANKTLKVNNILSTILQFYEKNSKIQDIKIIDSLKNPLSKISRAIIGLAAIQFSQLEQSSLSAINYLKRYAKQEGFEDNDWYKLYVNIIPSYTNIHLDQFPAIELDDQQIINILQIAIQADTNNLNEIIMKISLIKEVIIAHAFGFTFDKPGYIPKIRGECIEIESYEISSIKSYRPILMKKHWFTQKLSEVLVEKEFFQIQELPSWVQSIDISNEVLLIKGCTENKDIGEYILNIINKQNFILKQLRIIVVSNPNQVNQVEKQQRTEDKKITERMKQIQFNNQPDEIITDEVGIESTDGYDSYKASYFEQVKRVRSHSGQFNQITLGSDHILLSQQGTLINEDNKSTPFENIQFLSPKSIQ